MLTRLALSTDSRGSLPRVARGASTGSCYGGLSPRCRARSLRTPATANCRATISPSLRVCVLGSGKIEWGCDLDWYLVRSPQFRWNVLHQSKADVEQRGLRRRMAACRDPVSVAVRLMAEE